MASSPLAHHELEHDHGALFAHDVDAELAVHDGAGAGLLAVDHGDDHGAIHGGFAVDGGLTDHSERRDRRRAIPALRQRHDGQRGQQSDNAQQGQNSSYGHSFLPLIP